MRRIRNRFAELLAIKARREGRGRIPRTTVTAATGLALGTVDSYINNTVYRFDGDVLMRLCEYLECEISDLLVIEDVISPENETPLLSA